LTVAAFYAEGVVHCPAQGQPAEQAPPWVDKEAIGTLKEFYKDVSTMAKCCFFQQRFCGTLPAFSILMRYPRWRLPLRGEAYLGLDNVQRF
jgi:hypothetical protein